MLALAATGACLFAILGPSEPVDPSDWALYKLRSSGVMLAKQLAPAPRHFALNGQSEAHGGASAEFVSTSALMAPEVAPPEGAPTSIEVGNRGTVSEVGVEASRPRASAIKHSGWQWILRSSYASVHQHRRGIAARSRQREKASSTYARYYRNPAASVYARYQIAGQGQGYGY